LPLERTIILQFEQQLEMCYEMNMGVLMLGALIEVMAEQAFPKKIRPK